jgi:hypothetical protein
MAVAHPPLVDRESEMNTAAQPGAGSPQALPVSRKTINPILVTFFVVMAVFPFVVQYLPAPVREYLGSLFR